jgi:antitoxin MazE
MTEAAARTEQWGKHVGVRLPASVARAARLTADQRVRITVEDGRVIITPDGDKPRTLNQRLALFDPATHGGEAMAATPMGRERW